MPQLSDDEKPALLDERLSLRNAQAGWGAAFVVSTGSVAAILTPLLAIAPTTLCAVVIAILKRQENSVDRALDDPPRQDFSTETRARSRRYVPGRLGPSQLAMATDAAAIATLRVTAYLDAMVRADERAQGAQLAGDLNAAQHREWEARRFLERARAAEALKAIRFDWLGIAWANIALHPEVANIPVEPNPDLVQGDRILIPPEERAEVRSTGLVIHDLDLRPPAAVPLEQGESAAKALVGAATESRQLARKSFAVFEDARSDEARWLAKRALPPSPPPEYELGHLALQEGQMDKAQRLLQVAAEQGSPDAMFELGELSVARTDIASAEDWFRKASETAQIEAARPEHRLLEQHLPPSFELKKEEDRPGLPRPPRKREEKGS